MEGQQSTHAGHYKASEFILSVMDTTQELMLVDLMIYPNWDLLLPVRAL